MVETINSAAITLSPITSADNDGPYTTSSAALSQAKSMGDMNYDGESEKLLEVPQPPLELDEDDLENEEEEFGEPKKGSESTEAAHPTAANGPDRLLDSVCSQRTVHSVPAIVEGLRQKYIH